MTYIGKKCVVKREHGQAMYKGVTVLSQSVLEDGYIEHDGVKICKHRYTCKAEVLTLVGVRQDYAGKLIFDLATDDGIIMIGDLNDCIWVDDDDLQADSVADIESKNEDGQFDQWGKLTEILMEYWDVFSKDEVDPERENQWGRNMDALKLSDYDSQEVVEICMQCGSPKEAMAAVKNYFENYDKFE